MVRSALVAILTSATAAASIAFAGEPPVLTSPRPPVPDPAPVREALARGRYPWYDARADTVKPVWPPREWNLDWLDRLRGRIRLGWLPSAGSLISFLLAMVGLTILLAVLARLWWSYEPGAESSRAEARRPGTAARIESLPAELRLGTADPWTEAVRCRARGDYARAIVCLFAHQLRTLERLRQIRLAPGRTGRQLVRGINDQQLRDWVDPTLRLFEAVYYGHRTPSAESFEPVWTAAEAFERRVAEGVAP
jgi:hypothetical protein